MKYFDPEQYYNTQPKEEPSDEDPDLAYEYFQELHGAFNENEL